MLSFCTKQPKQKKKTQRFLLNALLLILLIGMFHSKSGIAQSLGINTTGAIPDSSAMLDIISPNKGLLIPRVSLTSTTDVTTILNPSTSLLVYNTNATITGGSGLGYYYYNGSMWMNFLSGTGNSLTTPLIIGGSGTTSSLTYKPTTGVGITGADHIFKVGDNGAIEAARIRMNTSDASLLLGSTTTTLKSAVTGSFPLLNVVGLSSSRNPVILIKSYGANVNPPTLALAKSRGTSAGTETTTLNTDKYGFITFEGVNGNITPAITIGASIAGVQEGTAGTTYNPTALTFTTSNGVAVDGERMRINSAGNVGIGTIAPAKRLSVKTSNAIGDIRLGNDATVFGDIGFDGATGTWIFNSNIAAGAPANFNYFDFKTDNTSRMVIRGAGNVGIGITSPTSALHLVNTLLTTAGEKYGVNFSITGAGALSSPIGLRVNLASGYTGALYNSGATILNSSAGTGTDFWTVGHANRGADFGSAATTTGNNVGAIGYALGSSSRNIGVHGIAWTTTATENIGVVGQALAATANRVGVFAYLGSVAPTALGGSYALMADNGTTAAPSFQTRDNGTPTMTVADGGNVGIGTITPAKLLTLSKPVANAMGASIYLSNNQYANNVGAGTEIIFGHFSDTQNPRRYSRIYSIGTDIYGTAGRLTFGSSDDTYTDAMSITFPNNYVGIGTITPNSTLQVNGALSLPIVNVTGNYTVLATDYTIYVSGGSAGVTTTVTLPTLVAGRIYVIKNASLGDVSLVGTIDSGTNLTISAAAMSPPQSIMVQGLGGAIGWVVISRQ